MRIRGDDGECLQIYAETWADGAFVS